MKVTILFFYWGWLVEEVYGAGLMGRVKLERVLDMQLERDTGEMDFRLRKVILQFRLGLGAGMSMINGMARLSEMVRLVLEML